MEDGYRAAKMTALGDECVGFRTNVDKEGFWIITEIELLLVQLVDASPSWFFRMHESRLMQKL
jgi:hypothetical protein